MGFRSNLISEDTGLDLPNWFIEKYSEYKDFYFDSDKSVPFTLLKERKYYDNLAEKEIFIDIQKVLKESTWNGDKLVCVLIHECGGITRVEIWKDKIIGNEPTSWKTVDCVNHNYCYGCSDVI